MGLFGRIFGRSPSDAQAREVRALRNELGATRAAYHGLRARYEAAETTNENAPLWSLTDYLSARAANNFQVRRTLKIRSRYEAANNSYFRGIVNSLANDLIGVGPRLQARTKDPADNRKVEAAWRHWFRAIGGAEKLRLKAKAKIVDGEGLGLLMTNRTMRATWGSKLRVDEDAVQLDVAVIESDQVTTPDAGFVDEFWVDGIVLDRLGNPSIYHVLKHHPGDLMNPQLNPLEYDKWPARYVLHWLRKDRPGQARGIPELTPALDLFAQLRRFTKAVLTAAETAADIAAYLESQAPADTDPNSAANSGKDFDTMQLDRGLLTQLPFGWKLNQLNPAQPSTNYEMFVRVLIREICRCLGIPLSLALGDTSGSNFSSARMEHLPYWRQLQVWRAELVEMVLDKLLAAWLEEAVMIPGLLPDGITFEALSHAWHFPAAESIDPVKDAQADALRLASGTTTLSHVFGAQGLDWQDQLDQQAQEAEALAKRKLPPTRQALQTPTEGDPVKKKLAAGLGKRRRRKLRGEPARGGTAVLATA